MGQLLLKDREPGSEGDPMAEALPAKAQPHHSWVRWAGQSQDGSQDHPRACGDEAGPRSGWEHKSASDPLRVTRSDTAQRSPGRSMVTRQVQVQGSKSAPSSGSRSRLSTAREGHNCSGAEDQHTSNKAQTGTELKLTHLDRGVVEASGEADQGH